MLRLEEMASGCRSERKTPPPQRPFEFGVYLGNISPTDDRSSAIRVISANRSVLSSSILVILFASAMPLTSAPYSTLTCLNIVRSTTVGRILHLVPPLPHAFVIAAAAKRQGGDGRRAPADYGRFPLDRCLLASSIWPRTRARSGVTP